MFETIAGRLNYANVVATLALFVALGGGAYAALGKNTIKAKQIASGAVRSAEVKDGGITLADISTGAVNSDAIADGSVQTTDLGFGPVSGSNVTDGTSNTLFIGEGTIGAADIGSGQIEGSNANDGTSNTIHIGEGTIGSADIGAGQVRVGNLDNGLGFLCPIGTRYFQGACIETANRAGADFVTALSDCIDEGRWLPDPGQLRGFGLSPGITLDTPGYEWAEFRYYDFDLSGTDDNSLFQAATIGEGSTGSSDLASDSHKYRCVATALGS